MYCEFCDTTVSDQATFCPNCGKEIKSKPIPTSSKQQEESIPVSQTSNNKRKKKSSLYLIFLLFVLFIAVVLIECSKMIQVPYEQTEYEEVPLTFTINGLYAENCGSVFNYVLCYHVKVKNTDTQKGEFKINCEFNSQKRNIKAFDVKSISPEETVDFLCKADVDYFEDVKPEYVVIPDKKKVSKTVIKSRSLYDNTMILINNKLKHSATNSKNLAETVFDTPELNECERYINNRIPQITSAMDKSNPITRDFAVKLASNYPGEYNLGQIATIYDYLRNNWKYVNDPKGTDYFSKASNTINLGFVGDCDDFAILMATMIESIGGTTRIIIAEDENTGHAYAEVRIGEMSQSTIDSINNHYRGFWDTLFGGNPVTSLSYHNDVDGDWLNLDWSSKYPGGPFFQSTKEYAVYDNGLCKKIK